MLRRERKRMSDVAKKEFGSDYVLERYAQLLQPRSEI